MSRNSSEIETGIDTESVSLGTHKVLRMHNTHILKIYLCRANYHTTCPFDTGTPP